MLKIYNLVFILLLFGCSKSDNPQPLPVPTGGGVYNNGRISTGSVSNNGTPAPIGTSWSETQNEPGSPISNTTNGIACSYNNFFSTRCADDFIIPIGQSWTITRFSFYCFGASNFDALRVRLWDGDPSQPGSSVIFGNLTTNVLTATLDSNIYCIRNSSVPAPGITPTTTLRVWKLSAGINKLLPAGTYWVEWQVHATAGEDCYSPFIKVKDKRGEPGWNAKIFNTLNVWQAVLDQGNPITTPFIPQDLPFEIVYTR